MTNTLLVVIIFFLFFIIAFLAIILGEIVHSRHQDELQTSSRDDFDRMRKISNNSFVMLALVVLGAIGYMVFFA